MRDRLIALVYTVV